MLPVLRLSSGPPVHRGTIAGRAAVTSYDLWIRSEIVEVAAARDVWVISDECYLYFAYPPALPFTAGQLPEELRSRVMICGSFSKTHAMTGWRLGFALGPQPWIQSMLKVQSHSTSNANSMTQKAAVEAAIGPQDAVASMI